MEKLRSLPFYLKLDKAVTFEDLAAREALKHLSITNLKLDESFCIDIKDKHFKALEDEKWRDISVCLVEMSKYSKVYNEPEDSITLRIEELYDDHVELWKATKFNHKLSYHADFVPNRAAIKACHHALDSVERHNWSKIFLTFDHSSIKNLSPKIESLKRRTFKDFKWNDKSIANNLEQQLAIKNIINCTAYPYPQIVFGPPGELPFESDSSVDSLSL